MRQLLAALGVTLLVTVMVACSDDEAPPSNGDGQPPADGGGGDGVVTGDGTTTGDQGPSGDGVNPLCAMPGPCVLSAEGEGKHTEDALVIGEILTLTGTDLGNVDTVYLGASVAPLISATATKVTCRVGPRTPPGDQPVEVKAGNQRRKFPGVTVRRLVVIGAADSPKLQVFQSATHSAGPTLDLGEAPTVAPSIGPSGRHAVALGKTKLVVADLALEQVATVGGLTNETVSSWAIDDEGARLVVATASGKLLAADLSGFPTLTASAVSGAPTTAALATPGVDLLAGLHPTATSSEGSLWVAQPDLKSFSWLQQGSAPYLLGTGSGLQPVGVSVLDSLMALVVQDGATLRLAWATVTPGALTDPGDLQLTSALGAAVAAGGSYVALSGDGSAPTLAYAAVKAPAALKSVTLGGSGSSRVVAFGLPTLKDGAAALVGPTPAGTAGFVAGTLELVDLAKGERLTSSGGAALTLADMRAAVGDPTIHKVHLVSGTHFYSYIFSVSATNPATVTVTEQHPHQQLLPGVEPRWIAIQP